VRRVPVPPELVRSLSAHIDRFKLGRGGRLFVARTGRAGVPLSPPYDTPVSMGAVYRTWQHARIIALTPDEGSSALARRPYDLRHAAVSLWLSAGVPAPQVAEWAGHSVNVLLRVYAKIVDGQYTDSLERIEGRLSDR
jgi:integrase